MICGTLEQTRVSEVLPEVNDSETTQLSLYLLSFQGKFMKLQVKFDQGLPFSGTMIRFCRLLVEYRGREVGSAIKHLATETTGIFISPSGISELDCATTETDTAERSISRSRESLQVLFVLGALAYFQVPPLGCSREEKWRSQ